MFYILYVLKSGVGERVHTFSAEIIAKSGWCVQFRLLLCVHVYRKYLNICCASHKVLCQNSGKSIAAGVKCVSSDRRTHAPLDYISSTPPLASKVVVCMHHDMTHAETVTSAECIVTWAICRRLYLTLSFSLLCRKIDGFNDDHDNDEFNLRSFLIYTQN